MRASGHPDDTIVHIEDDREKKQAVDLVVVVDHYKINRSFLLTKIEKESLSLARGRCLEFGEQNISSLRKNVQEAKSSWVEEESPDHDPPRSVGEGEEESSA